MNGRWTAAGAGLSQEAHVATVERTTGSELEFVAPGPGAWGLDVVHVPRPATRIARRITGPALTEGFRRTIERYGMPSGAMRHASVHGFTYTGLTPLDPADVAARGTAAAETWATKRWRGDIERWDREVKPASIRRHLELGAVETDRLSDDDLVAHLRSCVDHTRAMITQHHWFNGSALVPLGDFLAFASDATGSPTGELLELFAGASPVSSGDCEELRDVLHAVRADRRALALLERETDGAAVLDRLRSGDVAPDTAEAVRAWLALVGYRLLDGFDVHHPYALERPGVLASALRSALRGRPAPDTGARLEEVRRKVPADQVAEFDERYGEAHLAYRIRDERGVYSDATALGLLRRAMLAVGRRLVERGDLDDAELAVDADDHELAEMVTSGSGPGADELRARRRFRETYTIADAPRTLGDPPSPPFSVDLVSPATMRVAMAVMSVAGHMSPPASEHREEGLLKGVAANPGRHRGRARVVHTVDDLLDFEPGDVLVAITTAESFNLALSLASAVVTDQGGLLSHAAILAREYGIPAVVGTGAATTLIDDGAVVVVDGSAGEVTW